MSKKIQHKTIYYFNLLRYRVLEVPLNVESAKQSDDEEHLPASQDDNTHRERERESLQDPR